MDLCGSNVWEELPNVFVVLTWLTIVGVDE